MELVVCCCVVRVYVLWLNLSALDAPVLVLHGFVVNRTLIVCLLRVLLWL